MSRKKVMRLRDGSEVETNPYVFFDIVINGEKAGRLIFELRHDILPMTTENFRLLCRGEEFRGLNKDKLTFKGSSFSRIRPGVICQGGEIKKLGGSLIGASVYDKGQLFDDENFYLRHLGRGVLSMVNDGPDSNASRFMITFARLPMLDGRHVAFGYVCGGMDVLDLIEMEGHAASGRPLKRVVISHCGELVNPAEFSMPYLMPIAEQMMRAATSTDGAKSGLRDPRQVNRRLEYKLMVQKRHEEHEKLVQLRSRTLAKRPVTEPPTASGSTPTRSGLLSPVISSTTKLTPMRSPPSPSASGPPSPLAKITSPSSPIDSMR